MYTLDIRQNASMLSLGGSWQLINTNTNGVTIDSRVYGQAAQISDTQLLISSGFNTLLVSGIQDQTIVYDTTTNSWSSYANYTEGSTGNRQMYVFLYVSFCNFSNNYGYIVILVRLVMYLARVLLSMVVLKNTSIPLGP
jgi:hypothetical protein